MARPILTGLNYLNLYFWLDPRYTSPTLMQIGVRNLQQDGNITIVKGFTYTSEEITDPYEWDGFDQKLISYTKSVVIGG